jgi:hypothetical protein
MPTEPKKPLIVISYAHADEPEHPAEGEVKWLSFVTGYLRPAIKRGAVDLWLDRLMPGGADWEREIGEKLRACDVFILLVEPEVGEGLRRVAKSARPRPPPPRRGTRPQR